MWSVMWEVLLHVLQPLFAHILALAPAIAPPSLQLASATSISIRFKWKEIPCHQRNGRIGQYVTRGCKLDGTECISNSTETTEMELYPLIPDTTYRISVNAVNINRQYSQLAILIARTSLLERT